MTFVEFREDLFVLLENSTVNLGRKQAKTRDEFLKKVRVKFINFEASMENDLSDKDNLTKERIVNPMDDRVVRIKPQDRNKALDIGKGVHAMSGSESMRADEQLNRSPFGAKKEKEQKGG